MQVPGQEPSRLLPGEQASGPGQRMKGGGSVEPNKKQPSAEVEIQRRVRRLERIVLILCVATILLGLTGIRLAWIVGRIVSIFDLITEQLNLIGQQVDAIRQGVQGIQ